METILVFGHGLPPRYSRVAAMDQVDAQNASDINFVMCLHAPEFDMFQQHGEEAEDEEEEIDG